MQRLVRLAQKRKAAQRALEDFSGSLRTIVSADQIAAVRAVSSSATPRHAEDGLESAAGSRTQLLMIGSYAVSQGSAAATSREALSGAMGGDSSSRQMYMEGSTVTSTSGQSETSSSEESSEQDGSETEDLKKTLLEAALRHVKEKGWTAEAIQQAASDLHLSPAAVGVFKRPQAELVEFFVNRCNTELTEKLQRHARDLEGLRPSERISTSIKWRLEMLIPYIDSWPQALAIHTSPGSLPTAIRQVGQLVNEIWYASGDKSADFNWYTKRAALAAIYAATEAYMLTDYSPGYADTWESLDRRLQDVRTIARISGKGQAVANDALESLSSTLQWVQNNFQGSSPRDL